MKIQHNACIFFLIFIIGLVTIVNSILSTDLVTGLVESVIPSFESSFDNSSVGDVLPGTLDGHFVKLNDSFYAVYNYGEKGKTDIYKTKKISAKGQEEYTAEIVFYTGLISNCYCSEDYLICYLYLEDKYVVIDCNDKNNIKKYDELAEINLDFSEFTFVRIIP